MPFEYKHEAQASESVYFENTHSLALHACITDLFTYVVSIPEEKKRATRKLARRVSIIQHPISQR
jgi:hypothetical protein